jgi:uncharacterized protein YlzI (FlbEa/FlbD family)
MMNPTTFGESAKMQTDVWLTPPALLSQLGEFDLDPCSPVNRPWDTAKQHYTIHDNGLVMPWSGRVWLNPPYGRQMIHWLHKMALHLNGMALTFARTETAAFQRFVFPFAMSMLFLKGRINFLNEKGLVSRSNAAAPSVLISYTEFDADVLADSGIEGKHLLVNAMPVITIQQSPDWRSVVSITMIHLNGKATLSEIYEVVERIAPDKIAKNKHYKEKVRQKLQKYFQRVQRGQYQLFQ